MRLFGSAPRYGDFFELFRSAGDNAEQVTALLLELMQTWPDERPGLRAAIKECEHKGDRLTHDVMHHLAAKASVPLDSSDAHALASELDDVVDFAEEVADFMLLYRIEAPTDHSVSLAEVLHAAASEIAAALRDLNDVAALKARIAEVDRLEDEGDRLEREALSSLFDGGIDPMVVIRWKDLYERLEEGIDACEHVANVLESISVKKA